MYYEFNYLNSEYQIFFRNWMYLEPIFASPDIKDQLPIENKKFNTVQRTWIRIMKSTLDKPWVRVHTPHTNKYVANNLNLNYYFKIIKVRVLHVFIKTSKLFVFPRSLNDSISNV